MNQLVEWFDKLAAKRDASGRLLPQETVAIRLDLKAAMDERNALVQSSWPMVKRELARGWRTFRSRCVNVRTTTSPRP